MQSIILSLLYVMISADNFCKQFGLVILFYNSIFQRRRMTILENRRVGVSYKLNYVHKVLMNRLYLY